MAPKPNPPKANEHNGDELLLFAGAKHVSNLALKPNPSKLNEHNGDQLPLGAGAARGVARVGTAHGTAIRAATGSATGTPRGNAIRAATGTAALSPLEPPLE